MAHVKLPHYLRKGDKGEAVGWLQDRLIIHLGNCLPKYGRDKDFGQETYNAVISFQKAKHLEVDGIVGPQSQAYLHCAKGHVPNETTGVKPPVIPAPSKRTREQAACDIMGNWVNLTENPAGSNIVPKLRDLGKKQGWSPSVYGMGFSWCDYGVSLALDMASSELGKLVSGTWSGYTGMYCPSTQNLLEKWVSEGKAKRIAPSSAKYGDIVLFDWENDGIENHIGFARGRSVSGMLPTRECNTSSGNAGSQSNGDGVYNRSRSTSLVASIYRITI